MPRHGKRRSLYRSRRPAPEGPHARERSDDVDRTNGGLLETGGEPALSGEARQLADARRRDGRRLREDQLVVGDAEVQR